MKKEFLEKVKHEGIVDTRKYRYVYSNGEIKRLPIEYLDTTAALSEWEVVLNFKHKRALRLFCCLKIYFFNPHRYAVTTFL